MNEKPLQDGPGVPIPDSAGDSTPFAEKHPQAAKLILVGVWIYVAALWLLALDQLFNWGIFGPKVPPT
jgi:hypothetical protein